MKIFLFDQKRQFRKHLERLKKKEPHQLQTIRLTEASSTINVQTGKKLLELDTNFFMNYQVFPERILSFLSEWSAEKRSLQVGDTIVQQVFIPPFKLISQKFIFGVRITKIFNESHRIGFSYITLQGHAECGISSFSLEESENEQIIFRIHTLSAPGNLLTRLLGPVFTLPYQRYCTRLALANVKKQLDE